MKGNVSRFKEVHIILDILTFLNSLSALVPSLLHNMLIHPTPDNLIGKLWDRTTPKGSSEKKTTCFSFHIIFLSFLWSQKGWDFKPGAVISLLTFSNLFIYINIPKQFIPQALLTKGKTISIQEHKHWKLFKVENTYKNTGCPKYSMY